MGANAGASTPRWTTGPPYFTVSNTVVIWYTDQPLYFTDPGDLSASVTHAAADSMVESAASVWNVPSSRMVLQQGGTLDEQVSGDNVYPSSNGLVFPADASPSNYAAKQIAIVYDRDGSVTDLLLGGGAGDPSECRQNAVTESVDQIAPSGFIQHAVLILNGRCTGPAPEQQLQMQYQLERAFGRVLGVGWSQLNDNVFTGTPQPTRSQALHWPIMHPIDIICGPYSYQCLPQPFTLRDDDVASMILLYPVSSNSVPPGKQPSLTGGGTQRGDIYFPTGEGMAGVNVLMRRNALPLQVVEDFDDVSAVTGFFKQQVADTPITRKSTEMAGSFGSLNYSSFAESSFHDTAGFFYFPWTPIVSGDRIQDELFRTEAINPLYTGVYAVGPYSSSTITPSGTGVTWRYNGVGVGWEPENDPTVGSGSNQCSTSGDGTEANPAPPSAGGWWTGVICGSNASPLSFAHTAWTAIPLQNDRSLTVEMTALDEAGLPTVNKLRPVLGLWGEADAVGGPPGAGMAAAAFNSVVLGMTAATAQTTAPDTLRIAMTDEMGDGRPDFNYRARILYADSISPAAGTTGTQVTITGMGFRAGNTVTINGVAAKVAGCTATSILATVPLLKNVLPGATTLSDVVVSDLSTRGTTTMGGAFVYAYSAPVYTMQAVSAPGDSPIGQLASPPFSVRVLDVDGTTPLAGATVTFTTLAGSVTWSGCSTAPCAVLTDTKGLATLGATPTTLGTVTLQAASLGTSQTANFSSVPLVRTATASPLTQYIAAGSTVNWIATAGYTQQGSPAVGAGVVWSTVAGPIAVLAPQSVTDGAGLAQATLQAGPLAAGTEAAVSACAWTTVCAEFVAHGVGAPELVASAAIGVGQSIPASGRLTPVSVQITDAEGHPVAGASVQVHQTVSQWTAPCPATGRCPIAPVYQVSNTIGVSGLDGTLSVAVLQIDGPEVTEMVVTSGTQGFVSLTLQKHP